MTIKAKKQFRADFFAEVGENILAVKDMLDHIPSVAMYIKAADGRIVALNRRNCEICNIRKEVDAVGRRSCDLFPEVLAAHYMADDRRVVETGVPLLDDRRQRCANRSNALQHKNVIPLRNSRGQIVGTMCLYWLSDPPANAPDWHGFLTIVTQYIQDHHAEKVTLDELARLVHLSVSAFSRLFEKTLGITPGEYITQVRIAAACRLLEKTDKTLTYIANETGFYDLSHLTKAVQKAHGMTPGEYRRRHRR